MRFDDLTTGDVYDLLTRLIERQDFTVVIGVGSTGLIADSYSDVGTEERKEVRIDDGKIVLKVYPQK